jgi:hypothetical protein
MHAIEEKEIGRRGKDKARPAAPERGAFELTARRSPATPQAQAAPQETPGGAANAGSKARRLKWKIVAGCSATIVIGIGGYAALVPSSHQSVQHSRVLQLKQEADQLVAAGKNVEAFEKYGQILLVSASETVHGSARRAVEEARQERLRLQPLVRDVEEKARLAKFKR